MNLSPALPYQPIRSAPAFEPSSALTEIELLLELYRNPRTRDVALDMADKNLASSRKEASHAQDYPRR